MQITHDENILEFRGNNSTLRVQIPVDEGDAVVVEDGYATAADAARVRQQLRELRVYSARTPREPLARALAQLQGVDRDLARDALGSQIADELSGAPITVSWCLDSGRKCERIDVVAGRAASIAAVAIEVSWSVYAGEVEVHSIRTSTSVLGKPLSSAVACEAGLRKHLLSAAYGMYDTISADGTADALDALIAERQSRDISAALAARHS